MVGDRRAGPEPVSKTVSPGPQEVRQRILELSTSVWAFAALSFALETGVLDEVSAPSTAGQISQRTGTPEGLVGAVLDVLVALRLGRVDEHGFSSPGLPLLPVAGQKRCSPRTFAPPTCRPQISSRAPAATPPLWRAGAIRILTYSRRRGCARQSRSCPGPIGSSPASTGYPSG